MSFEIWRIIACTLLVGTLASCGSVGNRESIWKPPKTFTEADLIGTWERVNPIYDPEVLIINADHTFTQIYDEPQRSFHAEAQRSWQVEYRASGCVYVHLEGMRNFHLTDSAANNGNRYPDKALMSFWEPCEDTLITMPDKVTLIVGNMPDFQRMIVLLFPRNGAESGDVMMWLTNRKPKTAAP